MPLPTTGRTREHGARRGDPGGQSGRLSLRSKSLTTERSETVTTTLPPPSPSARHVIRPAFQIQTRQISAALDFRYRGDPGVEAQRLALHD